MNLKKYFIAIVIPEPSYSKIEAEKETLHQKHGLKGALRSPAHITLHRPFSWKEEKEIELIETLQNFNFHQAFKIQIKDYSFFEPRVIYADVLPNETLNTLHRELTSYAKQKLKLFNESDDLRGFHPHITLANRDLKKPKFYELQKEFSEKKLDCCFIYSGFSLLKMEKKWAIFKNFPVFLSNI